MPSPDPVTSSSGGAADEQWRLRIRDADGVVRGAGMLVCTGQVLTCAHVVSDGPDPAIPDATVFVDFVALPGTPRARARVADGGWIPIYDDESGDLALLDLIEMPEPLDLEDVVSAPLRRLVALRGRRVYAFGFPQGAEQYGINATADLSGPGGPGGEWIQLDSPPDDRRVTGGFSGAAVVDEESGAAIGMVVMEYVRERPTVSWMVPIETILRHLPRLSRCVAGPAAVDRELAAVESVSPDQGDFSQRWGCFFRRVGPPLRLVVTGEPGSSVSSGLRSMIVLADRELRPRSSGRPGDRSVPPIGSVDLAVDASGKTVEELSARITDRFEPSTATRRRLPATIVVDGLDDAADPEALLRDLVKPLADDGIRLLLGSVRSRRLRGSRPGRCGRAATSRTTTRT